VRGSSRPAGADLDPAVVREIDEELRLHIEGRTRELVAAGLPPVEARRRALEAFGDVERVRREMREIEARRVRRVRRAGAVGDAWRDVRTGARRLRRSPGYAAVAVLTLALGIGASVAMFSVLNAVVLRPLSYPDADRLVLLQSGGNYNIALTREYGGSLRSVASYTGIGHWALTLEGRGDAAMLTAAAVDAGYFDVLGVRPVLGRAFGAAETEPSRGDVVLLGHGLWQSRFGGDAGVIGRRVRLSGYQHEERLVIGVMPAGHRSPGGRDADVWIPLMLPAGRGVAADSSWYISTLVARLAPGATVEQAAAEMRGVTARLRAEHPGLIEEERVAAATAIPLRDAVVGDAGRTLWLLLAAVGLVLLIACGNLANVMLARAGGRRLELAVQAALGASRGRLVREQLAECALLAVAGGLLGLLLAHSLLAAVRVGEASGLPRAGELGLDVRVIGFAAAATLASLALFGLLPALRATGSDPREGLGVASRGGSRGRGAHRLNRALVATQLALAMVLATAAGLVLSSFLTLRAVDAGIDPTDVLAVRVMPPAGRYTGDALIAYHAEAVDRLRALAGVEHVGGIHLLPFTTGTWSFPYLAEGHAPVANEPLPAAHFRIITPGYLDAVRLPLLRGRDIEWTDRGDAERVLLINRAMAELLWPGADPIGREIRVFGSMPHRVAGVVGDVRQFSLERASEPEMYAPQPQWAAGLGATMVYMVRAPRVAELAGHARATVAGIDPDVPIVDVRLLTDVLGDSMAGRRFTALVLAVFGALALLLGAVGVYGVMAHMVAARLQDYGVRMALGAAPGTVVREALGAMIAPAAAGLAAGTAAAIAVASLLHGLLYGIPPVHPPTYAAAALVLLAAAALAGWAPARRAGRTDPLGVLRSE
jgi:putative ABC transport system permease protein